jgi:hypothetical protein
LPMRKMAASDLLGQDRRDPGPTGLWFAHARASAWKLLRSWALLAPTGLRFAHPGTSRSFLGWGEVGPAPHRSFPREPTHTVQTGKYVCTGTEAKCSTCPVLEMCLHVGATASR